MTGFILHINTVTQTKLDFHKQPLFTKEVNNRNMTPGSLPIKYGCVRLINVLVKFVALINVTSWHTSAVLQPLTAGHILQLYLDIAGNNVHCDKDKTLKPVWK